MDFELNPHVISPRFLEKLQSGISLRADTKVDTLIKFDNDEALNQFVEKQNQLPPASRPKIKRVLRSVHAVAIEVRLDTLAALSVDADNQGINNIDENFRVRMLLEDTRRLEQIQAAWSAGYHGNRIRVAVLDTGIDDTHPDLTGVVVGRKNFTQETEGDRVGHGTHVSSIIASRGVADATRKGMADACVLLDGKVLGSDGFGSADDTIAAIEWAVEQKAHIINMSLGASGHFDGTDPLSESASWAVGQGVVVCAAAGNCGPGGSPLQCAVRGDKTIGTPGCARDVITVGAVDKTLAVAAYSSRGPTWADVPKPDVVTVGSDIVAARAQGTGMGTPVNDRYTRASGTSMATPVCSGIVALLLEASGARNLHLSPGQVKGLLKSAGRQLEGVPESAQGAGFLDAQRALAALGAEQPQPAVSIEVVSFILKNGHHQPGEQQTWLLTVRNASAQPVLAVSASLSSDQVNIDPHAQALGALGPNETKKTEYAITAQTAGRFSLALVLEYTTPNNEVHRQDQRLVLQTSSGESPPPSGPLDTVLNSAIARLLALQNSDGTWAGGIMYNAWTNGMYCILHRIMGLPGQPTSALDWLEAHRTGQDGRGTPNGTWGIVDDPSLNFLEGTIAAEIALEIWGRGRRQEVWDYIDQQATGRLASAISLTDPYTQMFAALASAYAPPGSPPYYAVSDILAPPLELILVPRVVSSSLPHLFAAWGQDAVIALMVMAATASGKQLSLPKQILLKNAEAHLLRTQNEDGSWYDTFLPTIAGTLAMYLLGYGINHTVLQKAVGFVQRLQRVDGYVARYHLPVWDTSLAILALRTAGVSAQSPPLFRAGRYLQSCQNVIGGIPFQRENHLYPDTDDTSFAILALSKLDFGGDEPAKQAVIRQGLRWLLYMQGDDGGWAAFGKNQAVPVKSRIPYFKDDPPTADVTGHVLSGLQLASHVGEAQAAKDAIQRGIAWLQRMQMGQGQWFGRWGLTYTYGTSAVLQGLSDVGEALNQAYASRGIEYLLQAQHADGGWGEGYATYYDFQAKEDAPSTIDQTAWSLLGLMAVPSSPQVDAAVDRGVQFLLDHYDANTGWGEAGYTVGALWIYKNTLYPLLWGIWALGLYHRRKGG